MHSLLFGEKKNIPIYFLFFWFWHLCLKKLKRLMQVLVSDKNKAKVSEFWYKYIMRYLYYTHVFSSFCICLCHMKVFCRLSHLAFHIHTYLPCYSELRYIRVGILNHKISLTTYSCRSIQIAKAVRSKTSLPSSNMRSHTRKTVSLGKQVEKSVKNHCMVNTLVKGGS